MDIYTKEFQKPSATVKMYKWCTYIVLMLCMHFQILLSHGGYIYYINLFGTDDVSRCTCMWCGDAYKDTVVF